MSTALSARLLEVHRALTLPEFWRSVRHLLVEAVPCHSVSLYLHYLDPGGRFRVLHHQNTPGGRPLPWRKRREISPAQAFLHRHAGRRIFTTEDLFSTAKKREKEAYTRHIMSAEGWRAHYCLAYWQGGEPQAIVTVRRNAAFSQAEQAFLASLYDHFAVALERIRRHQEERAVHAVLSEALGSAASGVLVLDEQLRAVYRNEAALLACRTWNHGPTSRYAPGKCFEVPAPVRAACAKLAAGGAPSVELAAPAGGQGAVVRRVIPRGSALARPFFFIYFGGASASLPAPGGCHLSPREAEVAREAAAGLSNAEIARKLGKSEITVKTQLSAAYAKLGLRRRSQLAPHFHSGSELR